MQGFCSMHGFLPHDLAGGPGTVPAMLPNGRTDVSSASFPPTVGSIPEARHFLADTVSSRVPPVALDVALLLLSELATNAVMHAGTPFVVGVQVAPQTLHVSVVDGDDRRP